MSEGILILSFLINSSVPLPTRNTNSLNDGSNLALIFSVNLIISNVRHNFEINKLALIASCLFDFGVTGRICRRSPPNTITLPPNGC